MNWQTLIIFIILCQTAGILGAIFTVKAIPTWYKNLKKPSFNPPNWLFGPVWTLLYLLMGVSGYLLWQNNHSSTGIILFFTQLALNAVWTPLFFGAKKLGLAFFEITLMWLAIIMTIIFAWNIYPLASILLIPYLFWVTFASVLNFSIWQLNK